MNENDKLNDFSIRILPDLACEKLGGKVWYATDDFFAEKENLIKANAPVSIPDKHTGRGKWMDGWESRRKRDAGHDWCVIQLAKPGIINEVDINTSHFLGNQPEKASLEGVLIEEVDYLVHPDWESIQWTPIISRQVLQPGTENYFSSESGDIFNFVRLHIYPDGGVARLRVCGEIHVDWTDLEGVEIDLGAMLNGGSTLQCNDMFFSHMQNLLLPERGINMSDGWETRRNRVPGNRDWVVIKLAHRGIIDRIIVDTGHFKGNYPDSCSIEGTLSTNDALVCSTNFEDWHPIMQQVKLGPDAIHEFEKEVESFGPVSHVRFNIFPDGGVSRLRLFGKIAL